jgi:hypothetical protein
VIVCASVFGRVDAVAMMDVSSLSGSDDTLINKLSLWGIQLFFFAVVSLLLLSSSFGILFLDRHGWSHRLAGAVHWMLLILGTATVPSQSSQPSKALLYDTLLASSGVIVTLTAAKDFPHRYVRNASGQSGTLAKTAMVTQAEMIEHSFYQLLNLFQALYLHTIYSLSSKTERYIALLCVTAPWWLRSRFPVHSFSHNWKAKTNSHETLLYRIKKAQYLFYKHVILHGLNLSLCVAPSQFVTLLAWRIFWICLHTSYVMEFFLQTLVKRKVLSQSIMLALNRWLMLVSTLAALPSVVQVLRWDLALASLVLNFVNRHHDVVNTMLVATLALTLQHDK